MSINHQFKRDINNIDQNNYGIILSFEILQESNNDIVPFELEVSIMGVFELENWEDENNVDMAINNATAILFPYLRNLVSTVTLNENVPPYLLPVMNVVELFNKRENK